MILQHLIPQNYNWPVEAVGYLAAAASVFVYVSNTMIPLRIGAIVANALFAFYFFLKGLYPLFALNAFLVPVNMLRLRQPLLGPHRYLGLQTALPLGRIESKS